MRWGLVLVLLVLVAAGCGGGRTATPTTATATTATAVSSGAAARETLPPRLRKDLRAIHAEAAKIKHNTLLGTPALQQATGRYLDDIQRLHLSLLAQNRAIDKAAAAVAGSCDQCFQMLEASRPIPAIAH
jgi:hypothetical protein